MSSQDASAPRFELRLFAADLDSIASRLKRAMKETRQSTGRSLYLLRDGPDDINAKLRGQQLEIKDLVATERGFEQWRPRQPLAFPLDTGGVPGFASLPAGRCAGAGEFVRACRAAGYVLVHVLKQRRHFELRDVLGEHARTLVNGAALDSIAIESANLDELADLRSLLQLESAENLSYTTALKRVTGIALLPADSACRATGIG
jgi:hypothetical protein